MDQLGGNLSFVAPSLLGLLSAKLFLSALTTVLVLNRTCIDHIGLLLLYYYYYCTTISVVLVLVLYYY